MFKWIQTLALRLFWNTHTRNFVLFLLKLLPIKRNRVICVCWGGDKYNCNPKAITDALLHDNHNHACFEICYGFKHPDDVAEFPSKFKKLLMGSLRYYYYLSTSHYIISNIRLAGAMFPYKKRHQLYIQTMHGAHGIKKVEFDVADKLPISYLKAAQEDTDRINLMLSESTYGTHILRTAFLYQGEILEEGLPRNDIFFEQESIKLLLKQRVVASISQLKSVYKDGDSKLLIYTPTFRTHGRMQVYGFDIDKVVSSLEHRFGGTWYIMVSSHPNMKDYYRSIYDFSHPRMIDVGLYPELQELLVVSDALITDYSSAARDFLLTKRPVFTLIKDAKDFDRGTYLDPKSLPFPYAEDDQTLCDNILQFDENRYLQALEAFNQNIIGLKETGHAAEAVIAWMKSHL